MCDSSPLLALWFHFIQPVQDTPVNMFKQEGTKPEVQIHKHTELQSLFP